MDRIAIIGLGMMGGSLGLGLKARRPSIAISGYTRSSASGEKARQRGAIDELHSSPSEAVRDADLVVLCTPILSMSRLVEEIRDALKKGCLLTDVGSTKVYLDKELSSLLAKRSVTYVGSHPLAGSEQQGIDAARANLYEGATVIMTPRNDTPDDAVKVIQEFWQGLGAVVREMDVQEHDRIVARTSHLPHMTASVLTSAVGRDNDFEHLSAFCASGFKDSTRIAEGSPEVWNDILQTNHAHVVVELKALAAELGRLVSKLEQGDFKSVQQFLEKSRAARKALVARETKA